MLPIGAEQQHLLLQARETRQTLALATLPLASQSHFKFIQPLRLLSESAPWVANASVQLL